MRSRVGLLLIAGACLTELRGEVSITPQENAAHAVEALLIAFTATKGEPETVQLFATVQIDRRLDATSGAGPALIFEPMSNQTDCTRIPQSGRLRLLVNDGALGKSTRVHITVHRDTCTGEPLSDAVWWSQRPEDAGTSDGNAQ